MTTSSIPFIRPLTLGEVLDQAIRLYRRNFLTFIGILAIPYVPLTLLQTGLSYLSTSSATSILENPSAVSSPFGLPSGYWMGMIGMVVVLFIHILLVNGIATAAFTHAVADNYTGQEIDVIGSYRKIGSSWARLIRALLLFFVIAFLVGIWTIIPCIGWITGPGLAVFLSMVVMPLLAPVVVLERLGARAALRRAWDLARTRFWWIVGFGLVLGLLAQLIVTGPVFLINFGLRAVLLESLNYQNQLIWSTVIQTLVQMLTGLLYLPLQITAMTVVYFDLRVRSEGLDLALQAAAASGAETNIIALAESTSPTTKGELLTGTDVGNFILLTLAILAIYFILFGVIFGAAILLFSAFS